MLFTSTWLLCLFSAVEVEGSIPSGAGNGPPGPLIDTSVPPPIPITGKKTSPKAQSSNSVAPPDANPSSLSTFTTLVPVSTQPPGGSGGSSSTAGVLAPPLPTLARATGVPNPSSPNSNNDNSNPGNSSLHEPPPSKTSVKTIIVSIASVVALVTVTLTIVIIRRRRRQAEHWRDQEKQLQEELSREKPGLTRVSTFKEAYDAYHKKNQRRAGMLVLQGGVNSSSTSADTRKSTSKDPRQPLEEFWNP